MKVRYDEIKLDSEINSRQFMIYIYEAILEDKDDCFEIARFRFDGDTKLEHLRKKLFNYNVTFDFKDITTKDIFSGEIVRIKKAMVFYDDKDKEFDYIMQWHYEKNLDYILTNSNIVRCEIMFGDKMITIYLDLIEWRRV